MRARAWVRDLKVSEAAELRAHIAFLEQEQAGKVASSAGMLKLGEIGQQLRWHRFRLALLDECVAGLSTERDR